MENLAPGRNTPDHNMPGSSMPNHNMMDQESESCLTQIIQQEQVLGQRVEGVRFVLVILSSKGMVYDLSALRQKILLSYPDSTIFFQTTIGKFLGPASPQQVDLLIDFTGPGQREGLFHARKLRRMARFAVGRNAGFFRKRIYDRIFDECASGSDVPNEMLQRERVVQRKVLNLAGVSFMQAGETPPDRGKSIALELPGMLRL